LLANTSHQRVRQRRALGGGPDTFLRRRGGTGDDRFPRISSFHGTTPVGRPRWPCARRRLVTKGGGQLAGAHGRAGGARSASESGPPPERLSDPGTFARTIVGRSRSVGMCRRMGRRRRARRAGGQAGRQAGGQRGARGVQVEGSWAGARAPL
jgi:hypothetical protein